MVRLSVMVFYLCFLYSAVLFAEEKKSDPKPEKKEAAPETKAEPKPAAKAEVKTDKKPAEPTGSKTFKSATPIVIESDKATATQGPAIKKLIFIDFFGAGVMTNKHNLNLFIIAF